jgi:hypothetical protein
MMILEVLCFFLGLHLTMLLVAACYRVIDLWYRISDYAVSILLQILATLTVIGLCLWLIGAELRNAFLAGQIFFVSFHITIYWLGRAVLVMLGRRSGKS